MFQTELFNLVLQTDKKRVLRTNQGYRDGKAVSLLWGIAKENKYDKPINIQVQYHILLLVTCIGGGEKADGGGGNYISLFSRKPDSGWQTYNLG